MDRNIAEFQSKVMDLLRAIDHNVELMKTHSHPRQNISATPTQYIAKELEVVRAYIVQTK